ATIARRFFYHSLDAWYSLFQSGYIKIILIQPVIKIAITGFHLVKRINGGYVIFHLRIGKICRHDRRAEEEKRYKHPETLHINGIHYELHVVIYKRCNCRHHTEIIYFLDSAVGSASYSNTECSYTH